MIGHRKIEGPPPAGGYKLRRDSLSKLVVYETDQGPRRVRYSLDWRSPRNRTHGRDQQLGLQRLEQLLFKEFPGFHHALIYDMETDEKILEYNHDHHKIPHS